MSLASRVHRLIVAALLCAPIGSTSAGPPSRQPLRLKSGTFDPLSEQLPVPEALRLTTGEGEPAEIRGDQTLHYMASVDFAVDAADGASQVRAMDSCGGLGP